MFVLKDYTIWCVKKKKNSKVRRFWVFWQQWQQQQQQRQLLDMKCAFTSTNSKSKKCQCDASGKTCSAFEKHCNVKRKISIFVMPIECMSMHLYARHRYCAFYFFFHTVRYSLAHRKLYYITKQSEPSYQQTNRTSERNDVHPNIIYTMWWNKDEKKKNLLNERRTNNNKKKMVLVFFFL